MNIDLNGKWDYTENYGYGMAKGVLYIVHNGDSIEGRIIFTDTIFSERYSPTIQEFLKGRLEGGRLILNAVEYEIIHSEEELSYELDSWDGNIISQNLITGESLDEQGIEGSFEFKRNTTFAIQ